MQTTRELAKISVTWRHPETLPSLRLILILALALALSLSRTRARALSLARALSMRAVGSMRSTMCRQLLSMVYEHWNLMLNV